MTEKKKVASVFSNALETTKQTPWAKTKLDATVTLTCAECGAAQEKALDFKCRYCGASYAKKE